MGQFGVLFNKNFLQWRRNTCGMICEVVTTIIFALFFILIGTQSDDRNKAATSYLSQRTRIGVDSSTSGTNFTKNQKDNLLRLAQSSFGPEILK